MEQFGHGIENALLCELPEEARYEDSAFLRSPYLDIDVRGP